jgi:hypothetical protein
MTLSSEDFRKARQEATAHIQIELGANGVTPESKRIVGTVVRIFRDSSNSLAPGEMIGVMRPVAGALDDWGPLTPPDDATWARARYVEVYLRRINDEWTIANGQLTLLRSDSIGQVNPAGAGGFGVTEGPGLRPSASTVATGEELNAAILQSDRDAAEVSKAPDIIARKPQPIDWGPVLAPWSAASRAQRIAITAVLILAPIMIIMALAFGGDARKPAKHGGLQTSSEDIARIERGTNVMDVPSGLGNAVVPGLNPGGTASAPQEFYQIGFQIDPTVEGIAFKDILGVTHGAIVCDEGDEAAKTGNARMWMMIADTKASDIRNEGDHYLVDGRPIAKKLSLNLDGHIFRPTEYSIMTTDDGRTLLTGLFIAEETFHAAFKNAQHMELASGERTLTMNTSGHEAQLTEVAGECTSLGSPF